MVNEYTTREKELIAWGMNTYKMQVMDEMLSKGILTDDVSHELLVIARQFVSDLFNEKQGASDEL